MFNNKGVQVEPAQKIPLIIPTSVLSASGERV